MSSTPYSSPPIQYQLKVYPVERTCLFELTSGNGLQQVAKLQYPPHLSQLYRQWQDAYLRFYQQLNAQLDREASREEGSDSTSSSPPLRGRVAEEDNGNAGALPPMPQDWRSKLVKAEAELTSEFDRWLRSGELFEIRNELVHQKWYPLEESGAGEERIVDLLITCGSVELARLPWEAWEIGTELGTKGRIRIARTSPNIRSPGNHQPVKRYHTRILAIFGDDTGLDFQKEKKALDALSKRFDFKWVVWDRDKNQSIKELKADIRSALQHPEGWDVLLFFGHSNETNLTGGEIAIAPHTTIQISEIAGDLTIARERGLQFALFNSCCGLKIADSLIDLGFPQVAVMREPIHNKVAQEFLVYFLQGLAGYKDAHDALIFACEALKLKQNLTYPSAPFIPSLFRHPNAQLFRLKPRGWKTALRQLLPSKCEAIALPILLLLSCYLPLHDELLARRLLIQSVYRDRTGQIEPISTNAPPPVLLVQIDEESIRRAKIADPRPMDRKYIAAIIDRLAALNAKVVGLDILFDRYAANPEDDLQLARSLQQAVSNHQVWFVSAAYRHNGKWLQPLPNIASPNWSIFGDIKLLLWAMKLAPRDLSSTSPLPFAYNLALARRLNDKFTEEVPQPNLRSSTNFFSQLTEFVQRQQGENYTSLLPFWSRRQGITLSSYQFEQRWFHPIIDFSIPPDLAYQRIPAWQLLESNRNSPELQNLKQQVAIVAGGFGEAGLFAEGQDNHELMPAIAYWHSRFDNPTEIFTGGEAHAYMIHHVLRDRLVIPVPDLWVVAAAILLGKGAIVVWKQKHRELGKTETAIARSTIALAPIVYGAASLQLFVSAAILLPWVLPSAAFWIYALPALLRKKTA
ncbi:MAG: CHASE2 domain-containing protein [Cyanobacteria bacterium J055]|nr:MAG: CHASE2 domain-containing protein [Cyanobacteria bacterium J055]